MLFEIILAVMAIIAGGIASLADFGIGSFLTPLVALKTGIFKFRDAIERFFDMEFICFREPLFTGIYRPIVDHHNPESNQFSYFRDCLTDMSGT